MMICSKIGADCPYPIARDNELIFVMMPFKNSLTVYDAIEQAVKGIEGKNFRCERADDRYTNLSIWYDRICKNIRRAKYCIVDTTGRNPNVFYELGFAHALEDTRAIVITQEMEDAPFDIVDMNRIVYTEKNIPDLRDHIKEAILSLEGREVEEGYANKSSDEVILDVKAQLRAEEERSSKFKNELLESEKREKELKEQIQRLESIKQDPMQEARNRIIEYEKSIAELRTRLKLTEKDKKETIEALNKELEEKEKKLKSLEEKYENRDEAEISEDLLDEAKKRSEAVKWFNKAYYAAESGNIQQSIELYTKAIELDLNYAKAYNNRGNSWAKLGEYEKAIVDHTKAIELDPNYAKVYYNRGISYNYLEEYEKAIADYAKAIELDPKLEIAYLNLSELFICSSNFEKSIDTISGVSQILTNEKDVAICCLLECIARKMLDLDMTECEKRFSELMEKEFSTTWSFDELEAWLQSAEIPKEKEKYIVEKMKEIKQHRS
jgi:tetratricopeptide (TPR) repeat protein